MSRRRHHYERAFEHHLRASGRSFVSVNDVRRSLLPSGHGAGHQEPESGTDGPTLKSFDFMLYEPDGGGLLIDIKGRKCPIGPALRASTRSAGARLENWVTIEDVQSLTRWRLLFGEGFRATFVFVYWCDAVPPAGLFAEMIGHEGRWYGVRAVDLDGYAGAMRVRSPKWRTVNLVREDFQRLSGPVLTDGSARAQSRSGTEGPPERVKQTLSSA